jgi:hypothetical protein
MQLCCSPGGCKCAAVEVLDAVVLQFMEAGKAAAVE